MRDFEFNFNTLKEYSNSLPYGGVRSEYMELFNQLNELKQKYRFPAINNDIGSFISLMIPFWKPEIIFEMGSGYGHSAFWYLVNANFQPRRVVLTEKRNDLEGEFKSLPWPIKWKDILEYNQADAFDILDKKSSVDLALIDGVKADYKRFLTALIPKMKAGGVVLVDNSYWRGSFLDPELSEKKQSARNIKELHEYIRESKHWDGTFIPYIDGLSVLVRTNF